jgi:L-lactate dehydrogenase complex protein LldG
MATREDILTAIRERRPPSRELPQIPDFHHAADHLTGLFAAALARLDGNTITQPPDDLQQWLTHTFPHAHRVYSTVPEATGTITPAELTDWAAPADIDVTIVRSPLGVAETGSILVTEKELGVNTIATLAEHLVVLLDPADLVDTIHTAYRHPSFQDAAYAVLLSGPSGSADIGGITVHPAQGVTTLTVILTP